MPVSKSGRRFFTEEQYKEANYVSALDYARTAGYPLIKQGNMYRHQTHDSMVFTNDGRWFWNSRNISGGALQMLMYYEEMNVVDAVFTLVHDELDFRQDNSPTERSPPPTPKIPRTQPSADEIAKSKEFVLPPKGQTVKNIFAYLIHTRCLDKDIVRDLYIQKKIYQSDRNNVVFVGYNENGVAASGFQRGTYTLKTYKGDVTNSRKEVGWTMGSGNKNTVIVYESAIDAISHATVQKINGEDYTEYDRVVLGGVAENALSYYLKHHPNIERIVFALDNDDAGRNATKEHGAKYQDMGYRVQKISVKNKDWNEDLQEMVKSALEQAEPVQDNDLDIFE